MANADKCHFLLSSAENHTININGFAIKNSQCKQPLGVDFDDQGKFDFHIEKLHALARVTPFMDLSKKRTY